MKQMIHDATAHICGFFAYGFMYFFGGYFFSTPLCVPARI